MSLDISPILKDWPYEPGQISARKIVGDDGTDKIQLRLDLGLLQMEVSGHPGGQSPHGHESLLRYYESLLAKRRGRGGLDEEEFELDEDACQLLRNEGVMYYHRYLAEFILEDYEAAVRDTVRNLRLMDFCKRYAREESDRFALEQHRPYVVMMRTRANGLLALRDKHPDAALAAVKKGIREIQEFCRQPDWPRGVAGVEELAVLTALAREIEANLPPDPVKRIKRRLAVALREERYEDAAGLRDELRRMTDDNSAGGSA